MPQCCVVPRCSARTSGHRFPKDPRLLKEWLIAIRREKFTPTEHSRVCNNHFKESDYEYPKDTVCENPKKRLKPGTKPSVFVWAREEPEASIQRSNRAKRRRLYKAEVAAEMHFTNGNIVPEQIQESDILEDCSDIFPQSEVIVEENSGSVGIQCEIGGSSRESVALEMCDRATNTECLSSGAFRIEDFRDAKKAKELNLYTGFDDYEHFMFVFSLLGPQVHHLQYYPQCTPLSSTARILYPADEFFLTVVKLRRGMLNKELSFRFDISVSLVSRIFITWINFLYCQLKELELPAPYSVLSQNLRFKGKECDSVMIIDCTEIRSDKPENPLTQQQMYSTYKSSHSLKVLIGISPTGTVTFVSDAYGGSVSDRAIFEKCGLSDKLQPGDVVLADRGFAIQDLLANKDVRVNIPDFVCQSRGQLEPDQLRRSKVLSSKRIHIERMIGLAKTYRILKGPLPSTLVPLGSRIIFVCFMLVNFRPNIVI